MSTDEIAPVWVLDDPRDPASNRAIAVAERLGVPHLRVPLSWNWRAPFLRLNTRGSLRGLADPAAWPFSAPRGPMLAVAAGGACEPVSLWLRSRFGTRIVHCSRPAGGWRARQFDLLVVPRHEAPPAAANVLPTLGVPHRISPLALSQARVAWAGRLSHLPRPLVSLLVGGGPAGMPMRPATAAALARKVAGLTAAMGGSILATTSPATGPAATDALAAGLAPAMHGLFRWGEPGQNPYTAMLGLADAIVVTGDSPGMICEACASDAPVFIAGGSERRLHQTLFRAGQARPLGGAILSWGREKLDEAGRVATEIRARMVVEGPDAD